MFFHWFLEKFEGREGVASWTLPNWRPGSNLQLRYMPLTRNWTQDPLVLGHTPTTEPHQPGHIFIFLTVSFEEQKIQLLIKSNYQCLILWLRFFCYKKTLQPVLIILLYFNSIHIKISWNSQLKILKKQLEKKTLFLGKEIQIFISKSIRTVSGIFKLLRESMWKIRIV